MTNLQNFEFFHHKIQLPLQSLQQTMEIESDIMRKILFALCMLLSGIFAYGQSEDDLRMISSFKFYGIDFSEVKVYAADETPDEFVDVFGRINKLMLAESDKYLGTLKDRLGKYSMKTDIMPSLDAIKEIDKDNLIVYSEVDSFTEEQLAEILKNLNIQDETGTGLVMIANCLDKSRGKGVFNFVFFDVSTRNILFSWEESGRAGGFGLRNYWAGSVHNAFKHIHIK